MYLQTKKRLVELYMSAIYIIEAPSHIFEYSPASENRQFQDFLNNNRIHTWALITADNPHSTRTDEEKNTGLRKLLAKDLEGYKILRCVGMDKASSHHEIGYFVAGISREKIRQIASKYEQNAVIFGSKNAPVEVLWVPED
jgi:DNA-directed RNA polymerase sigma subunit (sigma70/sigma32)